MSLPGNLSEINLADSEDDITEKQSAVQVSTTATTTTVISPAATSRDSSQSSQDLLPVVYAGAKRVPLCDLHQRKTRKPVVSRRINVGQEYCEARRLQASSPTSNAATTSAAPAPTLQLWIR
jgi:hypothetical protein